MEVRLDPHVQNLRIFLGRNESGGHWKDRLSERGGKWTGNRDILDGKCSQGDEERSSSCVSET